VRDPAHGLPDRREAAHQPAAHPPGRGRLIPLRDSRRPRRTPWITWLLAAACVGAFAWEVRLGPALPAAIERWAPSPAGLAAIRSPLAAADGVARLVAGLFLHGSLLHLAGNLAFLWVFGDDVEAKLGRARFLAFYLLCGAAATLAQTAATPHSATPMVGASGAIAGVLAAFLLLFPRAQLSGVLPVGCLLIPLRTRAFLFIPFWFLIQLAAGLVSWGRVAPAPGGVAWFAHLGGFLAGPPLVAWLRRR
jgi:membrane associated rhomboid family serine protease